MEEVYAANHQFALCFTIIAALSQGLGGLIVVLGVGSDEHGTSTGHLMSFSTGVMVYLAFMDIMADTSSKIGEFHANVAFFIGMLIFLLLEFCLPEVEDAQMAEIFGVSTWAKRSPDLRSFAGVPPEGEIMPPLLLPSAIPTDEVGSRRRATAAKQQPAPEKPKKKAGKEECERPGKEERERPQLAGAAVPSRSPARQRPVQLSASSAEPQQAAPNVAGAAVRGKRGKSSKSIGFTVSAKQPRQQITNTKSPEGWWWWWRRCCCCCCCCYCCYC